MRPLLTKLCAFLQRNIAIWGVDNDIGLFDDEKWEQQALHPDPKPQTGSQPHTTQNGGIYERKKSLRPGSGTAQQHPD